MKINSMLTAFYLQNLHFALNIFVAMVMSWCFWLYLDVWVLRKSLKESLKLLGFFILTISFLIHAFSLETTFLKDSIIPINIYESALLLTRILGYLFVGLGVFMEPAPPNPLKNKRRVENKKTLSAGIALMIGGIGLPLSLLGHMALPILASIVGLLYLYRATIGLEFHLRKISYAFFGFAFFELVSLRGLFYATKNIAVYNLTNSFGTIWWLEHTIIFVSTLILAKWVFGYLLKRLQSQLYIFFSISILLIFIVSTLSFTGLLLGNIQSEVLNQISSNAKVLDYTLEAKKGTLMSDIAVISKDASVAQALTKEQNSGLTKIVTDYLINKKLTFLVITDSEGKVVARGEDNERIGDSLSANSLVKSALSGKDASSIITQEGALAPSVLVSAASSIKDKEEVIGTVYAGESVDNTYLDVINKATGLTSSIYGGNKISATTLVAEDGLTRRIGISETNKNITSKVLEKGANYVGTGDFLNTPYFVSFIPLKDIDNTVVGMLLIGKPQVSVLATAGRSIQASFIVAGILWLLAIFPSFLIAGYIAKQMK
jgi:hypothetical protein